MGETASRRGFFKLALRDTMRGARGAAHEADALRGELAGAARLAPPPPEPSATTVGAAPRQPTERARPATRTASGEQLAELIADAGLDARADAVRALARLSVRLTHAGEPGAGPPGGSRLGGEPALADRAPWPEWDGEPLRCLLELDLAELAALPPSTAGLPARGRLLVLYAAQAQPSGLREAHRGAVRVLLDDGPPAGRETTTGVPLALSAELTLPRAWAAPTQALALSDGELAAWSELRDRLAAVQGTTPEDRAPGFRALHRLLGWPDERRGAMPLACELLARGAEPGDDPPAAHPAAAVAQERAGDWRLLLQLSSDEQLAWAWAGHHRSRLYLWIHEQRLAAGDLAGVRAFPQ